MTTKELSADLRCQTTRLDNYRWPDKNSILTRDNLHAVIVFMTYSTTVIQSKS